MKDSIFDKINISNAYYFLKSVLDPSPLVRSEYYSQLYEAHVYLKLDMMLPTSSFKIRGALNAVKQYSQTSEHQGFITASGGNHGLAIAYACQWFAKKCRILLPSNTPSGKVEKFKLYGVRPEIVGSNWDEANQVAMEIARKENWLYIHPFNDPHVISGQGTIIREIKEQIGTIDHFVCSIGGGGLITGCLKGIEESSMICQVYGVETIGAHAFFRSRKEKKLIELESISSLAESLGARSSTPEIFEYANKQCREFFAISDSDAILSLKNAVKQLHLCMELASSCNLAVLDQKLIHTRKHDNIVVLICGANIDFELLKKWINE